MLGRQLPPKLRWNGKNLGFFAYSSSNSILSKTIYEAVSRLNSQAAKNDRWTSWEDLDISGKLLFCEICKSIRSASVVIADITSLNFNVMFELGFAIGLKKRVIPVKDPSFQADHEQFLSMGIFDTTGYQEYRNYEELAQIASAAKSYVPSEQLFPSQNKMQPMFLVRSPIDSDGSIKLLSSLKKGYFRFRSFDPKETSRLSMHEAVQQVYSSITVIAHLLDPSRKEAKVHNSRCAFLCGMGVATGKCVLMLQEGECVQPLDYRDLIVSYTSASEIPKIVERTLRATANKFQSPDKISNPRPRRFLEKLDLGDVAAENEVQYLQNYFVATPQYQQARQGHARIVIGRKGAGKTALFYGMRSHFANDEKFVVLDLKPEGHQFTRLRELVLVHLSEGIQQHTLTAFWHYLLLVEILLKLRSHEERHAYNDSDSLRRYKELEKLCEKHVVEDGDFSERLMRLVDRIVQDFQQASKEGNWDESATRRIYSADIHELSNTLNQRLRSTSGLLILFDNIDKGFPTHGLKTEDALMIRCLLEASRKVEQTLQKFQVRSLSCIFLRRDVYDHLVDNTPDRGKDSQVNLDWSDLELLKELVVLRLRYDATEISRDFYEAWGQVFEMHVAGESSFSYIVSRTFFRPRDVLNFLRKCIQVAASRNHDIVSEDDILAAEKSFSDDMLDELMYEIRDVYPNLSDKLYDFLGNTAYLDDDDIKLIVWDTEPDDEEFNRTVDALLWFSFIGIVENDKEYYSYQYQYNLKKLRTKLTSVPSAKREFSVHPAFRSALELSK